MAAPPGNTRRMRAFRAGSLSGAAQPSERHGCPAASSSPIRGCPGPPSRPWHPIYRPAINVGANSQVGTPAVEGDTRDGGREGVKTNQHCPADPNFQYHNAMSSAAARHRPSSRAPATRPTSNAMHGTLCMGRSFGRWRQSPWEPSSPVPLASPLRRRSWSPTAELLSSKPTSHHPGGATATDARGYAV